MNFDAAQNLYLCPVLIVKRKKEKLTSFHFNMVIETYEGNINRNKDENKEMLIGFRYQI